jgi:hypothetical protein
MRAVVVQEVALKVHCVVLEVLAEVVMAEDPPAVSRVVLELQTQAEAVAEMIILAIPQWADSQEALVLLLFHTLQVLPI